MALKTIGVAVIDGKVICGKDGGNVRLRQRDDDEVVWSLDTSAGMAVPPGSYLVVDIVPVIEEDGETPQSNPVRKTTRGGGRAHFPARGAAPGIYKYSVTVMPAGYTVDPIIIVEQ